MGTTPIYGFPYPDPSDLVANYPALGQQLAEDIEDVLPTLGGLVPVAPTSIANSGGSASVTSFTTTFSAVTSLSLNGVFTSSFQNYRIVLSGQASASPAQIRFRMRVAGSDNSDAAYSIRRQYNGGFANYTNETSLWSLEMYPVASQMQSIDMTNPAVATLTGATSVGTVFVSATNPQDWNFWGLHNVSTAYDGITFFPNTGNMTGTISVYGYKS